MGETKNPGGYPGFYSEFDYFPGFVVSHPYRSIWGEFGVGIQVSAREGIPKILLVLPVFDNSRFGFVVTPISGERMDFRILHCFTLSLTLLGGLGFPLTPR